jgi:hypothetical protein
MKYQTVTELEQAIAQRTQQFNQDIKFLEAQLAALKLPPEPEWQLAKQLHAMLCTWNHTDGCGWYYEIRNKQDDWTGHAHDQYLTKARMIMHQCDQRKISVDTAIEVYKMVKGT